MTTVKENKEKHYQTFLLSILTAATIGCFGFLWNVNGNIIILQESAKGGERDRMQMQQSINDANARLVDVRDRVLKLEAKEKK